MRYLDTQQQHRAKTTARQQNVEIPPKNASIVKNAQARASVQECNNNNKDKSEAANYNSNPKQHRHHHNTTTPRAGKVQNCEPIRKFEKNTQTKTKF
jgi:hypothetical protein